MLLADVKSAFSPKYYCWAYLVHVHLFSPYLNAESYVSWYRTIFVGKMFKSWACLFNWSSELLAVLPDLCHLQICWASLLSLNSFIKMNRDHAVGTVVQPTANSYGDGTIHPILFHFTRKEVRVNFIECLMKFRYTTSTSFSWSTNLVVFFLI